MRTQLLQFLLVILQPPSLGLGSGKRPQRPISWVLLLCPRDLTTGTLPLLSVEVWRASDLPVHQTHQILDPTLRSAGQPALCVSNSRIFILMSVVKASFLDEGSALLLGSE